MTEPPVFTLAPIHGSTQGEKPIFLLEIVNA